MLIFFLHGLPHPVDQDLSEALLGEGLKWNQINQLLRIVRDAKPDLTVSALQTFIFIVLRLAEDNENDVTVKEVSEGLGAPYATVARNCDVLCEGPKGRGGLGWLMKTPGKQPKTKAFQLTSLGHLFLKSAMLGAIDAERQPLPQT